MMVTMDFRLEYLGAGQVARILHTRYALVLATYLINSRNFRGGNLTTQSSRYR